MFDDAAVDDSRATIMEATFRALQKHSYADLSIQRIADETDLSKSTFYHHYEGKNDLLLSFLEFMLDSFTRSFSHIDTGDPRTDLDVFFDAILFDAHPETLMGDDPERGGEFADPETIRATVIELRAHSLRDPRYREQFTAADRRMRNLLASIIERGIDEGVFRDVEAERTAEALLTMAYGTLLRPQDDVDSHGLVRRELDDYVDERLVDET